MSSLSIRTPTWVSRRRLFEQKLAELHKCKNLNHLKQVHALIYKANLHRDLFVAPKLITALSLCRQMVLAVNVFNQILYPNVHLYNGLIMGHIQNSDNSQALATFFQMQKCGVWPDNFTYSFVLKACLGHDSLRLVQMFHAHIEKYGFCSDIFVPNSLIGSYSKCGSVGISVARKLFGTMEDRDKVSWNSMIGGLVKAGELKEAQQLFDEMHERDAVSWNTMLDGHAKAGDMNAAFELFEKMPERNVVSWTTMVFGYCKAGDMQMARMLFDKMPVKNLVTWTVIISGYAERGLVKDAVGLYEQMEDSGFEPDDGTIISILAACAQSGLLGLGERVHAYIKSSSYKCRTSVANALLDMYAKCGRLNRAVSVFNGIAKKDLVSWNAMIQGLAMHGHGDEALQLFSRMKHEGFTPDRVTIVGVLCACTHAGFIDKGLHYFHTMETDYGIVPKIEHYGCVIDLLGRGGRLRDAFKLVHSMPMEPNAIIRSTLLAACGIHNVGELANDAHEHVNKLEITDAGNFSMLSNIYAAAGHWDGVATTRLQMKTMGFEKMSGASSIELDDEVHEFMAKDTSHPNSESIYRTIDLLCLHLKQVGYVPKACC